MQQAGEVLKIFTTSAHLYTKSTPTRVLLVHVCGLQSLLSFLLKREIYIFFGAVQEEYIQVCEGS